MRTKPIAALMMAGALVFAACGSSAPSGVSSEATAAEETEEVEETEEISAPETETEAAGSDESFNFDHFGEEDTPKSIDTAVISDVIGIRTAETYENPYYGFLFTLPEGFYFTSDEELLIINDSSETDLDTAIASALLENQGYAVLCYVAEEGDTESPDTMSISVGYSNANNTQEKLDSLMEDYMAQAKAGMEAEGYTFEGTVEDFSIGQASGKGLRVHEISPEGDELYEAQTSFAKDGCVLTISIICETEEALNSLLAGFS